MTQAGVTVLKRQSSNVLIFSLYSENPAYDMTFLQNYTNINIVPQIKRVTGVGDVTVFGSKDYSIRIWLDPNKMAAYGLVPSDISTLWLSRISKPRQEVWVTKVTRVSDTL